MNYLNISELPVDIQNVITKIKAVNTKHGCRPRMSVYFQEKMNGRVINMYKINVELYGSIDNDALCDELCALNTSTVSVCPCGEVYPAPNKLI